MKFFEHLRKEFQLKYFSLNYKNLNDDYQDEDKLLKLFHDSFVSIFYPFTFINLFLKK
jgi:hypothetical protein